MTTPTKAHDTAMVTQADREAAYGLQSELGHCAVLACVCVRRDDCPFVEAFARHRTASQAELLEALERFVEPASDHPHHVEARNLIACIKGEQS